MSSRVSLLTAERILHLPQLAVLVAAALGVFTLIFGAWTATSIWSFPRFVLAVLVLIYFPGKVLLDVAALRLRPLDDLTLSLVLGITVGSVLYWISAFLSLGFFFLLWPLLTTAMYFYRRRKRWSEIRRLSLSFDGSHILLVGVMTLSLSMLIALPMYYRNAALLPQGDMTLLRKPHDALIHLSMASELTHSIPPQVPFFAGKPVGFHYAMDLLAAMFSNTAWLSVPDLTVRFTPTLFLVTTVLAIFSFSRVWLHSRYGAVLAAFLVVFGEDFSFIPGLLLGSQDIWSAQFFGVPTTFSLYFMNPMLPALGILFGALFCLVKFSREEGRAWLILTAFLFAILIEYKAFVTIHVLIAVATGGFIYALCFRDTRLLKVLALTSLLAVPLVLHSLFGGEAGARLWVRIDPWPYIPEALEQLGLLNTSFGYRVDALFDGGPATFSGLAALFLVALPAYLLGSLGLRVLAIPGVLKELFSPSLSTVASFFIALFVIFGPLITLTVTLTARGYPDAYNNAVWFYVQSKYVAWVFVAWLVLILCKGRKHRWQGLMVAMIVLFAVPSTIQYFQRQMLRPKIVLEATELEVIDYLKMACSDGQVILANRDLDAHLLALTPCRVPVLNLGRDDDSVAAPAEMAQRNADRDAFWEAWNSREVRIDILERYGVAYVALDKRTVGVLPSEYYSRGVQHGSGGGERAVIRSCMENEDFAVYEVSPFGG